MASKCSFFNEKKKTKFVLFISEVYQMILRSHFLFWDMTLVSPTPTKKKFCFTYFLQISVGNNQWKKSIVGGKKGKRGKSILKRGNHPLPSGNPVNDKYEATIYILWRIKNKIAPNLWKKMPRKKRKKHGHIGIINPWS